VFENRVKVQFENGEYWAPAGYDEYLRNLFGDYMQLPPVEQRKSTHTSKDYWKE
jgi:lipopolysaccharide cholinephosphotransferase